jgi:hypothetical protein
MIIPPGFIREEKNSRHFIVLSWVSKSRFARENDLSVTGSDVQERCPSK